MSIFPDLSAKNRPKNVIIYIDKTLWILYSCNQYVRLPAGGTDVLFPEKNEKTETKNQVSSGREQYAERAVIFSSGKEKPQGILSDCRGFFCRMTEKAQAIDVPGTDGADENKETGEDNVRRAHSPV